MKAVVMDGYGGTGVLRLAEAERPVAGAGQVLIRIHAIGVNPADAKWRMGLFADRIPLSFPHVLGYDVAGVVEDAPPGAPIGKGARVAAMLDAIAKGGYAEYAIADAGRLALLPDTLGFDVAAGTPTPGLTGVQIVEEHLDVQAGASLLVTGAVGAVGRFALHAARARGAWIIAAVRASQRDEAVRLGADAVLTLGEESWSHDPIDAVADTVGGRAVAGLCQHVRPGGRIVSVSTTPIPVDGLPVAPRFVAVYPDAGRLAGLLRDVAAGAVEMPVAKIMPLEQAARAHRLLEAGGAGGKIVLRP